MTLIKEMLNNKNYFMKKLTAFIFFSMAAICNAQNKRVDSLSTLVKTAGDDIATIRALNQLSSAYENYKQDSAILYLQMSLKLSRKVANETGEYKFEYYALSHMAFLFGLISNYPKALEYNVESLKLAEKMDDPKNIATANSNIAFILENEEEYDKAFKYFKIADSIIQKNQLNDLKDASLGNFGYLYYKLNKLDSALYLTMEAYELSKQKQNNYLTGLWLSNIGNIYSRQGNIPAAFANYREALIYSEKANDVDNICESSLGLARLFEKTGDAANAISYGNRVMAMAEKNDFESRKLEACEFLAGYYKKLQQPDSAFKYQEQMTSIKDSIHSSERIRQSLIITIDEELRQLEIRETLLKEKEERNKTLQLLAAGMFIPSLFLFILFISRRKIKPQVIKFCGIASLLMLFECITLLLHPRVIEWSNHLPIIELLIFVCIAAVVIPAHHRIERWLLSKLTGHAHTAHT